MERLVLAALLLTTAPSVAEATCRAEDLIGKWSMSVVGISSDDTFVGFCNFSINDAGAITGSCKAHNLQDSFRGRIAGAFSVSKTCLVRGEFATQDIPSDVQARMNMSKDVITGISLSPGTINQFTSVKR